MSDASDVVKIDSVPNAEPLSASDDRPSTIRPILIGLAYLALWQVAPRLRTDSEGAVLTSTLLALAISVWFAASAARAIQTTKEIAANAILSGMLVIPMRAFAGARMGVPPWNYLQHFPGLSELLFFWFAVSVGVGLSRLLKGANMIPPVAAVLALVDIWTVLLGGPVKRIMESPNPVAQAVTQAMTAQMPSIRIGAAPYRPSSMVGFADFVFIAFFVAAVCKFVQLQGTYKRTLIGLIAVLCAYMPLVHFFDWNLPALVPMGVLMIGLHWRHFHYERSEAFALLYAGVFIAMIALGFWYFGRRTQGPVEQPRAERSGIRRLAFGFRCSTFDEFKMDNSI
jgi:hypothetical protein